MSAKLKCFRLMLLLCCRGLTGFDAQAANALAVGPELSFGLTAHGKVDMRASDPIGALRSGAVLMVNTITVSDAAGLRSALLTAATNGLDDVIVLAAGTYATGGTTFSFLTNETNSLTLQGANGTTRSEVVLDGGGTTQVLKFDCVGSCGSITLQGLTVQNGNATGTGSGGGVSASTKLAVSDVDFSGNASGLNGDGGGAIYGYYVTVTNSLFNNNASPRNGGAIYGSGTVTVTNSSFTSNTASGSGGATYGVIVTVTNSTFSNNRAYRGGAIDGFDSVTNSVFSGNTAENGGGAIRGSGTVTNSSFDNNASGSSAAYSSYSGSDTAAGGAIYGSGTEITNSLFNNNTSRGNGGAFYGSGTITNSQFNNNTTTSWTKCVPFNCLPTQVIIGNGGALFGSGPLTIVNNTFSGNSTMGSGAAVYSTGSVINSVFYGHATPAIYATSAYNLYNNLIDTSTGIAGSIPIMVGNVAPGATSPFVDATNSNFRLVAGSLAIDAGLDPNSTTFANLVGNSVADIRTKLLTDLDGNPRPRPGTAVDIGAYEFSSVPTCALTANPTSIVAGGSSTLTASCSPTATSYVWTGGTCAGTAAATCTVTPTVTTTYSVAGVNAYGTGPAASATVTVPTFNSQSDCLFNWAEGTYPTLFAPPRAASITVIPWYYRYYSQTDAYLGTSSADNHVYYKGPASGYSLHDAGAMSTWLTTAGCQ